MSEQREAGAPRSGRAALDSLTEEQVWQYGAHWVERYLRQSDGRSQWMCTTFISDATNELIRRAGGEFVYQPSVCPVCGGDQIVGDVFGVRRDVLLEDSRPGVIWIEGLRWPMSTRFTCMSCGEVCAGVEGCGDSVAAPDRRV